MCEANVYLIKEGREETLMERVDRIIPGEDGSLFLESVFGERKVVQARIREMELVHHRVILEEIVVSQPLVQTELWLEPATDHGHFHAGEEVVVKLNSGYNMKPDQDASCADCQAFAVGENGAVQPLNLRQGAEGCFVDLGQEADGMIQIYAVKQADRTLYGKLLVEIGHHHHHGVKSIGLPLEISPARNSHPRMGESYEIQVLRDGHAWPGAEVRATYSGTRSTDYPHRLVTDTEGRVRIFLTARGNYLFTVEDDKALSTFTLVKGF